MQSGDITDGETEESSHRHRDPKAEAADVVVVQNGCRFAEHNHEWYEEKNRVDVAVQGEKEVAVVDFRQDPLGEDGVQGDEEGGQDAVDCSGHGQRSSFTFLIDAQPEADDDDDATEDGAKRRAFSQKEIGRCDVEHRRQRTADVVERDADVFEAQVVERDHGHKHDREGQHLTTK